MRKLFISLITIVALVVISVKTSGAFLSDTETSRDNILKAGNIDLKVNGQDNPSAVVTITDLKPGDEYNIDKTLFVDFNPSKIYLHIKDLVATQGAQTEPEELEEQLNTPKWDIHNYLTYDLVIDGETIIDLEDEILLPDAESCWIPLGEIPGNQNVTLKQSFHFPDNITNWAQGDVLTFTEEFLAMQVNDPGIPDTGSGRVWDPQLRKCVPRTSPTPTTTPSLTLTPTPTPIACTPQYLASAEQNNQGKRKNLTNILADRTDPNDILGAPQSLGTPYDNPVVAGSFFSLGFTNGSIVGKFNNVIPDQPGTDFVIYEVTGGTSYPDEKVKVEGSMDGISWTILAGSLSRDGGVDMDPAMSQVQYLRLTEVSNVADFEDLADGYDLDAVYATCGSN